MADITAEQVARAIVEMREKPGMWHVIVDALGDGFARAPDAVRRAWSAGHWDDTLAALTRWHAELVAAETPRKVARWVDGDRPVGTISYRLTPPHDCGDHERYWATRAQAIAWGYTIEGGPEVAEDSPERLKARREALGWSMTDAALVLGGACDERDIGHYEAHDDGCCMPLRTAYAAALSAAEAEARRAAKPDPLAYADPPAFDEPAYSTLRQPAPEVVDVPQPPNPVAKRCGTVLAKHWPGDTIMHIEVDGGGYVRVPVALLRAMLAAIDAQQPAPVAETTRSEPTTADRPEPRYKVGDWVQDGSCPSWRVAHIRAYGQGGYYYAPQDGFMGTHEDRLTPALDPALHETARRTLWWLRRQGGAPRNVAQTAALPGYAEWARRPTSKASNETWAAQLERLLGDAS